jgi:hypothetical protein
LSGYFPYKVTIDLNLLRHPRIWVKLAHYVQT